MKVSHPTFVGEEQFLALPESTERVELLDGEVIVSPSPSPWHQQLVLRLASALEGWANRQAQPVFVGLSPLDVRFSANRILQPDLFVILEPVTLDQDGPLVRVPDVCVEIASRDRTYDRVTKRLIYAEAGVREFWFVEPAGQVERWCGLGLRSLEAADLVLASPLLPGFELGLAHLFRQ